MNRFFETQKNDGNVFFYILLGVFLFGALTYALMQDDLGSTDTSPEEMNVAYTQILQYQSELRQAVQNVFDNGASEADIRFAHPDAFPNYGDITTTPEYQIFSGEGGSATYKDPPAATKSPDPWHFSARFRAPKVGSDNSDLLASILRVSKEFCDFYNEKKGISLTPTYPTGCIPSGDFFTGDFTQSPFVPTNSTISPLPAPSACLYCSSGDTYSIYSVIYAR